MREKRFIDALHDVARLLSGLPPMTVVIMPERRVERIRDFFGPGVEFVAQPKREEGGDV